jgi:hypothetical protein
LLDIKKGSVRAPVKFVAAETDTAKGLGNWNGRTIQEIMDTRSESNPPDIVVPLARLSKDVVAIPQFKIPIRENTEAARQNYTLPIAEDAVPVQEHVSPSRIRSQEMKRRKLYQDVESSACNTLARMYETTNAKRKSESPAAGLTFMGYPLHLYESKKKRKRKKVKVIAIGDPTSADGDKCSVTSV